MHAETGFEGLQNGFFGFSFGGYRRGVSRSVRRMIVPVVVASEHKRIKTYAMLDGGSNCDVISKKLAKDLKLTLSSVDSTLLLSVEGGNYGSRDFTEFAVSNLDGDVILPISDALVSEFLTTEELYANWFSNSTPDFSVFEPAGVTVTLL